MTSETLNEATKMLGALARMNRKALAEQWATVFGHPAPSGAQVTLLRSALAWHYQIGHEAEAEVTQLITRLRRQASSAAPMPILAPGTRLLREWQGRTHHVTVLSNGFEYNGKAYRSLTAISRVITGTAWSGPSFFGLYR